MAEVEPVESGIISEALNYALHHPIKVLGNTAICGLAVHYVREWKGPVAGFITRQFDQRRQGNGEEQSTQHIEER